MFGGHAVGLQSYGNVLMFLSYLLKRIYILFLFFLSSFFLSLGTFSLSFQDISLRIPACRIFGVGAAKTEIAGLSPRRALLGLVRSRSF